MSVQSQPQEQRSSWTGGEPHQAIRKTCLPNHLLAPGNCHSSSVQRPALASPNNVQSKMTQISVIKEKHEVHFVADWLPNNGLSTVPRAKLPYPV